MDLDEVALGEVWAVIAPVLDERQRRVVAGGLAKACGRGGLAGVARATGHVPVDGQHRIARGRHR